MKKKALSIVLTGIFGVSLLSACGNSGGTATSSSASASASYSETASTAETAAATTSGSADSGVPSSSITAFDNIEFPDEMPTNPTLAEDNYYDYDDMSQSYDIELMTYNYGKEPPSNDPIKAWLEKTFNVNITFSTINSEDTQTILSTKFSSGQTPDVIAINPTADNKNLLFTLGEQGLLTDAKKLYPYMPQTCKFVTKTLITYSTMSNGEIPFTTKYAVQDGDIWNFAIRADWLKNLGMEQPKTQEELMEYAKAVTFNDPDGNGKDDTWFMTGAGGGANLGMLGNFAPFFGNPSDHVEDGKLVSPMFDGSTKSYLQFLNDLYNANVLAPDWYTIGWEEAKAYTLNDQIGMLNYPASNLYEEYSNAKNKDFSQCSNWIFLDQLPIENAKAAAGGNAGTFIAIPSANVEGNDGKLMRLCHILDSMCYGGNAYFQTVQGGGLDVYPDYSDDVRQYNDDGTSYCYVAPSSPAWEGSDHLALDPWQNFGYTLKWQLAYSTDSDEQPRIEATNDAIKVTATYPRWNNDALLINIPGDTAPNLPEFQTAQEYNFVTGARSFNDWDDYIQEWLDNGGRDKLAAEAESLGAELPDEMK